MTENNTVPVWAEKTVPLLFPLKVEGGAEITKITMREPDAEALEAIEALGLDDNTKLKTAQTREIIALLSGVDANHLKKLNIRDLTVLGDVLGPLLSGEEGGAKPKA